jgi:hypothetical protein
MLYEVFAEHRSMRGAGRGGSTTSDVERATSGVRTCDSREITSDERAGGRQGEWQDGE